MLAPACCRPPVLRCVDLQIGEMSRAVSRAQSLVPKLERIVEDATESVESWRRVKEGSLRRTRSAAAKYIQSRASTPSSRASIKSNIEPGQLRQHRSLAPGGAGTNNPSNTRPRRPEYVGMLMAARTVLRLRLRLRLRSWLRLLIVDATCASVVLLLLCAELQQAQVRVVLS